MLSGTSGILDRVWKALLLTILALLSSTASPQMSLAEIDSDEPEMETLKAIVVMNAASGESYMADRDFIRSMPRLTSEEEMKAFISRYRANEGTVSAVLASLKEMGFVVSTHDDIFAFIAGTPQQFAQLVSPSLLSERLHADGSETKQAVFTENELRREVDYIEGMIVYPWNEETPQVSSEPTTRESSTSMAMAQCPDESITVSEVMHYLAVDRAHARGITGQGVNIGFVDNGVYTGHPFFFETPLDIQSYQLVGGQITEVEDNFSPLSTSSGHGTMVAAYLNATAPRARLHSFALLFRDDEPLGGTFISPIAEYINYMHSHNLVDVISLSVAIWEENVSFTAVSEIRTQMIYAISQGIPILVGSGNSGQSGGSGHNVLAAIPEVIAVGGATVNEFLDFSAAGGYDVGGITGAASFDSIVFQGRHVPDVVGIFGDDLCFPSPITFFCSAYDDFTGICGTSGATPQIAGMVALLIEQNPSITPTQIRTVLEEATFDITAGQSGDGDYAGAGYDPATGHGLPLATWVLNEQVVLHKGWNLIGLLKEHSTTYSALDMLYEINGQGGNCNTVSYLYSGLYKSVILDDGQVYGTDFALTPDLGYWVRCASKSFWNPSGTSYIRSPRTLNLKTGWNLVAVPYANVPCSVDDLGHETNWVCWRVQEYDGQMQDWQDSGTYSYGNNYLLRAGKGYFVRCDAPVTWTPDCSQWVSSSPEATPRNEVSLDMTHALPSAENDLAQEVRPLQQQAITNASTSNVTDQQFTVYWRTTEPSDGAVLLTNGYRGAVLFRAFDDRGARFSGTTHHVTLRGLQPQTIYHFAVMSEGTIAYDTSLGQPYRVTTGKVLTTPTNRYNFHGIVSDGARPVHDAVVTVSLASFDTGDSSDMLSFPVGGYPGYSYSIVLDNARDSTTGEYMDFSGAENLLAEVEGNAGYAVWVTNIDLAATPNIEYDFVMSKVAPSLCSLKNPLGTVNAVNPTFRLFAFNKSSNNLTYRIELSRDNFTTIERRYDQRESTQGWSASSYPSGVTAVFTPPEPLQNLAGYQWRAFAHNGEAWGPSAWIGSLAVEAPFQISRVFLPLVWRMQ